MSNDTNHPEGFEEHKPSGKKRKGPTMKERLIAQRKAELAAQEGGADAPKAQPAAPKKPAPAKPRAKAAGKPAGKPAAKPAAKPAGKPAAKPAAKPVAPVSKRRAAPAKAAASDADAAAKDGEPEAKPARSSARSSRASASRSGGRASSRRKGGDEDEGEERGSGRSGRSRGSKSKDKKPNLVPVVGSVLGVAVLGFGAFKLMGKDKPADASEGTPNAAESGITDEQKAQADAEAKAAADAKQAQMEKDAAAKAAAEKEKADQPKKPSGPQVAEGDKVPRGKSGRQAIYEDETMFADELYDPNDSAEPQLKTFEKFGKPEGCSDEQWATILEKVEVMSDIDAGAAGNRAASALEEIGKFAFPAIVNEMLELDLSTQDGHHQGDFFQRTLMNIANGRNAGWEYGFGRKPNQIQIINARVIELLYGIWNKVLEEPTYWDKYSNTEAARREKAGGDGGASGGGEEAPVEDNLEDDLGLDD